MQISIKTITAIMLVSIIGLVGFVANAIPSGTTIQLSQDDYCPTGMVCVATNMRAIGYGGDAGGTNITGIAVYKNGNEVIAQVPGHGPLSCYWSTEGKVGWHFNANGGYYIILNLGKDI